MLDGHARIIQTTGADGATVRLLAIKVALKRAEYDRAERLLVLAAELDEQTPEHGLRAASLAGLQAEYGRARALLEQHNRAHPRTPEVLLRLVQVCEQQRDYDDAAWLSMRRVARHAVSSGSGQAQDALPGLRVLVNRVSSLTPSLAGTRVSTPPF